MFFITSKFISIINYRSRPMRGKRTVFFSLLKSTIHIHHEHLVAVEF